MYGDDGLAECHAVRTLLYRLRLEDGLTILSRPAPWDARRDARCARAYRLVEGAADLEVAS